MESSKDAVSVWSRLHVSRACGWMDGMNRQIPEIKATTMVDDQRLYAVGTEKFKILEEAIEYTKKFDEEVGN